MPQKLILFDFDGTIADTFPVFLVFAGLEGFTFDAGKLGEFRDLSMRDALVRLHIPMWKVPFIAAKFHRYFRKASDDVRLVVGIDRAIRNLYSDGYLLGIVTTNSVENVKKILGREGIDDCFGVIRSERNVFGKARTLKDIVRRLGIPPETAWYVGDEVRDIEAAREAGLLPVSVTWGFNSESILRATNPDRLVSRPEELPSLFR